MDEPVVCAYGGVGGGGWHVKRAEGNPIVNNKTKRRITLMSVCWSAGYFERVLVLFFTEKTRHHLKIMYVLCYIHVKGYLKLAYTFF